ncbi:hypothetical protein [Arcobacter cloacae]|uniref:Uncharacterized protein n=1 Tax=Arcobacter cloacae TaxID=1054034 RepID=A0A4Q0ZDN8_9BACT|nr:hypothetical protein [Arcobacter cloacae]RXJ82941.1 hypothetical protein CRU90_12095 [Arcobacter cloacae]
MKNNTIINELLLTQQCEIYKFDSSKNFIYIDLNISRNKQFIYKELIKITLQLNKLNIKFKVDIDGKILLEVV